MPWVVTEVQCLILDTRHISLRHFLSNSHLSDDRVCIEAYWFSGVTELVE